MKVIHEGAGWCQGVVTGLGWLDAWSLAATPTPACEGAGNVYLQAYNAQAATNERQIVVAAEISVDGPDFGHLVPMVEAIVRELDTAGVSEAPEVMVATPATGTTSRWTSSPGTGSRS